MSKEDDVKNIIMETLDQAADVLDCIRVTKYLSSVSKIYASLVKELESEGFTREEAIKIATSLEPTKLPQN